MKKFIRFIIAMLVAFIPGVIGVMFTPRGASDAWYNALNKSVLTPDGWVFGVAWMVLYAFLGIAFFLIMNNTRTMQNKTKAYLLFMGQLALNALWTYMFFGLHLVGGAFVVLVALVLISIWMARVFRPINRTASYLVWIYIAWLIFATYLNGTIMMLN